MINVFGKLWFLEGKNGESFYFPADGADGIKPQVHGSTDVVIKRYRSNREL